MNAARIKRRLEKLEQRSYAQGDGVFTLEEVCRSIWQSDRKKFSELARQTHLNHFALQFELDDAERARATQGERLHDRDSVR